MYTRIQTHNYMKPLQDQGHCQDFVPCARRLAKQLKDRDCGDLPHHKLVHVEALINGVRANHSHH